MTARTCVARRLVLTLALAVAIAACGGTADEPAAAPASSTTAGAAQADLTGVELEVRRDPG